MATKTFFVRPVLISILSISLLASPLMSELAQASEQDALLLVPKTVQQPTTDVSFSKPPSTPQELPAYRTANSKRIFNPDGTFTEQIFSHPIHYKDATTRTWLPIDPTLTLRQDGFYHNKAHQFDIKLPQNATDGSISIAQGGASVSFKPLFADSVTGVAQNNEMTYKDITTATDLVYDVLPEGLKETMVLKSPQSPTSFSFQLTEANLTEKSNADGTIEFYKNGQKQPFFTLAKPYLEDANLQRSSAVTYSLSKDASGNTLLNVKADATWLHDPDRAYPVRLDPSTIQANGTNPEDALLTSGSPNTNYLPDNIMTIGQEAGNASTDRSLFYFTLPSLPSGAIINSANMTVSNNSITNTAQAPVIEAHQVTSSWSMSTVTWNTAPSVNSTVESNVTASNTTTPSTWSFGLTNLVTAWYNGTKANDGVELKYADETLASRSVTSAESGDTAHYPALAINYSVDGLGNESFWTFDGPVNMANENLTLSMTDISFPGKHMPVTFSRTYNSRGNTTSGVFGYGWSSTLDSKLYVSAAGPARYIDSDGTVHYFAQNNDGTYTSPPGLYWSLSVNGNSATITTTDKSQFTFTKLNPASDAFMHLQKIQDSNGNTVTFSYNSSEQLTSIVDGAAHTISFSYTTNVITVTDPANHQWTYTLDANGNLITVTKPDGTKEQYRYNSSHNLIATVSPNNHVTYYAYTSDNHLSSISPINIVVNGNFEVDADGNSLPDHFSYSSGYGGTGVSPVPYMLDTPANTPNGKAFRINSASNNTSNYTVWVSDPLPVDPSKSYVLSGYLKGLQNAGTQTTVLSVLAYDSTGKQLAEVGRTAMTGTFDWTSVKQSDSAMTLPAGTTTAYVKLAASSAAGTTTAGSGSSWWDEVQLEEVANPTPPNTPASAFTSGIQYTFSSANMQTATYDGEGHKHLYTYNANENITKFQVAPNDSTLNLTDSYTWDSNNNLTQHTDAKGSIWSYQLDSNGNTTSITDPNNKVASYQYDSQNDMTYAQDYNGNTTLYTYDTKRNNKTVRDPYSTSTAKEQDANGNVTQTTSELGWADNLLENSNFENGNNSDGTPLHFAYDSGLQSSSTWGLSSDAVFGTHSFSITSSPTDAQGQQQTSYTDVHSDSIPVSTADPYILAGYVKSNASAQSTVISLLTYDSNGNPLGEIDRMNLLGSSNGAWQRWSTPVNPEDFPSGTSSVRVKLGASNSSTTGTSSFDAIQFQIDPVDTQYNLVDNSSFERTANSWPIDWNHPTSGGWYTSAYTGNNSVGFSNAVSSISYSNYVPYDKTKSYDLTAFVKTVGAAANAQIEIETDDANKNVLSTYSLTSTSLVGDSDWKRLSVQMSANPSSSAPIAYIRPVLLSNSSSGTEYFDNIHLQQGQVTTTFSYDSTGSWLSNETDPLGRTTSYGYDASGNVNKVTDPLGFITNKTYDALNRLLSVAPPGNDQLVSYKYDNDGNLTDIYNQSPDQTTTYTHTAIAYNNLGQKTAVTNYLGTSTTDTTSYSYFPSGRLKEVDNPDGGKVSYVYDGANRITDVYFNGTDRYQYTPDSNSKLSKVKDLSTNHTWSSTYDNLDRLTSWGDNFGTVSNSQYDELGNVQQKKLTVPVGSLTKTESVTYNKNSQPTKFTDADQKVTSYLFNENGQITTMQVAGGVVTEMYSYDADNRITQVQNVVKTSAGNDLVTSQYAYDADGRKTSVTDSTVSSQALNYTYTPKGQLATEALPSGHTLTYTYDPVGNVKQRQETNGSQVVSTNTYTYNSLNEMTSINGTNLTYDNSGDMKFNGTYTFIWDAADRLTEVDNASTGAVVATYQYDNRNRRIQQTIPGKGTTNYLYDGMSNHVKAEFDASGNLLKYYTWSPTGQLLSLTVPDPAQTSCSNLTTSSCGKTYYAVHNGHGDIVQLRDAQGNIAASYQYDSWGKLTSTPTGVAAMLNPYRYADYRYDDATGLYYLIGRYYDPNVGRFLSPDPTNVTPDYTYGGNNPLSYVDKNGYTFAAPASGGGSDDSTNYDYNCTDNSYDYQGDDGSTDSTDSSNYGSSDSYSDSASSASTLTIPLMPAVYSTRTVVPAVTAAGEGIVVGEAALSVEAVALATPAAPAAALALVATLAVVGTYYLAKKIDAYDEDSWDEQLDRRDSMRGGDAKAREANQIKQAFGKDRATREKKSQSLHKDKKIGRNDQNKSFKELLDDYDDE